VLGLWGDPEHTGKPTGSDLLRRKKTLPVLMAHADPGLAAHIDAFYTGVEPTTEEVARLTERLTHAGCRARAEAMARARGDEALSVLDQMTLVDGPRAELADLVVRSIVRDR